jgi:hypothetical protein
MFLNYHAWLTDMLASKDIYNDPNLFDAYKQKLIALFLWPFITLNRSMGKQLVTVITCGCESSAAFL